MLSVFVVIFFRKILFKLNWECHAIRGHTDAIFCGAMEKTLESKYEVQYLHFLVQA
jgi:hypothetical protein